ncbi:MAG: SIMPL domain-containing protein [Saccharospirillaceae bacterium]|nr:SIMPL domain-containing protein [Saccharospirillaceae bacterium]MCD8530803.1 SIMPL domain-containing protein [Saccharospirillaceae bacterium]
MKLNTASAALLFSVCALFSTQQVLADDDRYIDVTGQGEVEAYPDYLQLHLTISDTQPTAKAAKAKVDTAMNNVLAISKKLGIREDDIDAAQISNQAIFEYDYSAGRNQREYKGEQVSRNVSLTLRDMEQYGVLVHELLQNSLVKLHNTELRFNDRAALEQQAMTLALTNARNKASNMAKALDNQLGKVLRIEEQGGGGQPMFEMRAMSMAKADSAPAPMLIQKQSISASAGVRFELK